MDTGTSWRSDASAAQYIDHDYADFAQEFLRRNRDYCRDYVEMMDKIALDSGASALEEEGLAGRWGLRFPLKPSR
jgi:hypothetical protein